MNSNFSPISTVVRISCTIFCFGSDEYPQTSKTKHSLIEDNEKGNPKSKSSNSLQSSKKTHSFELRHFHPTTGAKKTFSSFQKEVFRSSVSEKLLKRVCFSFQLVVFFFELVLFLDILMGILDYKQNSIRK